MWLSESESRTSPWTDLFPWAPGRTPGWDAGRTPGWATADLAPAVAQPGVRPAAQPGVRPAAQPGEVAEVACLTDLRHNVL